MNTSYPHESQLAVDDDQLRKLGMAANHFAKLAVFDEYRQEVADNTRNRQDRDLVMFGMYFMNLQASLKDDGPDPETGELLAQGLGWIFGHVPEIWGFVTWGLVKGFKKWLVHGGYAIGTVNIRLSTIRKYAELAYQAEVLSHEDYTRIAKVKGYRRKAGQRVDETRIETRVGAKKSKFNALNSSQMDKLINSLPNTPQGRRDRLLLALMCNLGLRVGEVAALTAEDFDLEAGELRFYRPKVDKLQTHDLINGTLQAATDYITQDAPPEGIIWYGSCKGKDTKHTQPGWGNLSKRQGLSERAITARVKLLGRVFLGIDNLSAHDLRHSWATRAAKKTPLDKLMEAGGWNSYAMPLRYIEAAKIANQGVILD